MVAARMSEAAGRMGEVFGGTAWQDERVALVEALKKAHYRQIGQMNVTPSQARMLAGLTSVADWIGSGPHFDNPAEDWRPRHYASTGRGRFCGSRASVPV